MSVQLPTLILSPDFSSYSKLAIGLEAKQVGNWISQKVPLPESILVTQTALDQVLSFNKLSHQPHKLDKEQKNKLLHLKSLALPTSVKLDIIHAYHHFLDEDFVKLKLADFDLPALNYIKGDATLLESIVELWLEALKQTGRKKNKLLPINILITRTPQADVSGVIYTHHPLAYSKSHYIIQATAGTWTNIPERAQLDTYQTDIRSHAVISKKKRTKNISYRLKPDGIVPKKSEIKQDQFLLNEVSLKTLTYLARQIALTSFKPLKAYFAISGRRVFITQIQTFDPENLPTQTRPVQKAIKHKLPSKVYLKTDVAASLTKPLSYFDGVFFSHQTTFFNFDKDPLKDIKTKRLFNLLAAKQWQRLTHYLKANPEKQLFFKLLDLEKNQFNQGQAISKSSSANFLGERGALFLTRQPGYLDLDFSLLKNYWTDKRKINLVIPFVRNPLEVNQIIKLIQAQIPPARVNFYLEIASAEPILAFSQYPLRKLSGLIIDIPKLQATVVGFNPYDHYLEQNYTRHTLGTLKLLKLMKEITTQNTKPLEVILNLKEYHYEIVSYAAKNHWHLVTNQYQVERTRLAVADTVYRELKEK